MSLDHPSVALDHSSGDKVYPDETLLETVGNLFPVIETYPEPQMEYYDISNYQTVRETPGLPAQLGIAPGPDKLR